MEEGQIQHVSKVRRHEGWTYECKMSSVRVTQRRGSPGEIDEHKMVQDKREQLDQENV